jgi:hypothetical protein
MLPHLLLLPTPLIPLPFTSNGYGMHRFAPNTVNEVPVDAEENTNTALVDVCILLQLFQIYIDVQQFCYKRGSPFILSLKHLTCRELIHTPLSTLYIVSKLFGLAPAPSYEET